MRSLPVEIRNICALLFFFSAILSCGGYYVRGGKKCIKAFLHQFEGLEASWFLRIMIYAQVGLRGVKTSVTHLMGFGGLLLGFPSIVLIMLPLYSCQHLLLIVYYSTSTLTCLFLNQWASHSKALWGFVACDKGLSCVFVPVLPRAGVVNGLLLPFKILSKMPVLRF